MKRITTPIFIWFFSCLFFLALIGKAEEANVAKKERNPMVPVDPSLFEAPVQKKTQERRDPYQIQGVGRSEKGTFVVLDGKVMREGETKGDITIVKINKTKVDILINGAEESIPIRQ